MTANVAEAFSMLLISGGLAPLQQLLIHQGSARPSAGAGHGVEVEHAVRLYESFLAGCYEKADEGR